jgi:DNA-binding winged helix-turn-helix (wHTH) protein
MNADSQPSPRLSFGLYEADLHTGELWKAGRRVRLQSQPFKVLAALLEHPGEVVSRTDLQTLIWGKDQVGEFDQSLGTAVNKIRDALGDHADNPRFIETLARRGYRFIAPVTVLAHEPVHGPLTAVESAHEAPAAEAVTELIAPAVEVVMPAVSAAAPVAVEPIGMKPRPSAWLIGGAAVLAFGLGVGATRLLHHDLPKGAAPLLRVEQLTHVRRGCRGWRACRLR